MIGEAGAETGHSPIGEDGDGYGGSSRADAPPYPRAHATATLEVADDVARDIEDAVRILNVDSDSLLREAVRFYRALDRARSRGDRIWVGKAPMFAEEWQ